MNNQIPPAAILVPGITCWRIARADKIAVIIDAAAYFLQLKTAILAARHTILLIGWDFDTRIKLDRGTPAGDVPNELGALLIHAVKQNPALHVYMLRWDLAFLKMPFRGTTFAFLMQLFIQRRLHFRLDSHHPSDACHHQKIAVIDDALAFCGGIDVTRDRWDTPEHLDSNPLRTRPDGTPHGPWHDITTAVSGPAAQALGDLARSRWQKAVGKTLAAPPVIADHWPAGLIADFHDIDIGIARTEPAYEQQKEAHEIEALYLAAIASARRVIYLESQYFAAPVIGRAIGRRLREANGPEIIVINPKRSDGWLEEEAMGSARALLLKQLQGEDTYNRFRIYTPVTTEGTDIYVHAKVLVIDDTLLRIGSSNINNRSLGVDTECDLIIEAPDADTKSRAAITNVRDQLLAEHLGVTMAHLRETLAQTGGSLTAMLDRLVTPGGKTLKPFTAPDLSDVGRNLAQSQALDPKHPEPMGTAFLRVLRILTPPKWRGSHRLSSRRSALP